ncbi:MAG: hypothetical protein ACRENP_21525 [Longimicrobiales bacterium]
MFFALLIAVCLASAIMAGLVGRSRLFPRLALAAAMAVPLAAFLITQALARPGRSTLAFQVLGQYHALGDAISIATDSSADFVLPTGASTGPAVRLALSYDGRARQHTLRIVRSSVPILLDGEPVNAVRTGRTAIIGFPGSSDEIRLTRPWWCWLQCAERRITRPGQPRESFQLVRSRALALSGVTLTLFRIGNTDYIAGDPARRMYVDGEPIPAVRSRNAQRLRVGLRDGFELHIGTHVAEHRLELLLPRNYARWYLPGQETQRARFLLSATPADTIPGLIDVIALARVTRGAARARYGGILERTPAGWQLHEANGVRNVAVNQRVFIPQRSAQQSSGYLVQLSQQETSPKSALIAALTAWVLGAVLLIWALRHVRGTALGLRVTALGLLYTLVFIRGALAFRVWLDRPYQARAPATFLVLLILLPALVAAYHIWQEQSARGRGWWKPFAPIGAYVLGALVVGSVAVIPEWRSTLLLGTLAPLALGTVGLWLLQRLLLARDSAGPRLLSPLAALEEAAAGRYSHTQFYSAVGVLAFLGFVLAIVAEVVGAGKVFALCFIGAAGALLLYLSGAPRVFVRKPMRWKRVLAAGFCAVAIGGGLYSITMSILVGLLATPIAGVIAWRMADPPLPRIRPFTLREALPAELVLPLLIVLLLLVMFGMLDRIRVLGEYTLALAGLIVIVRMFAVIWFRLAEQADQVTLRRTKLDGPTATQLLIGAVAVLAIAVTIFVPLGLGDPGLILLFFSAATIAALVGLAGFGARGVLLGAGSLAVLLTGFFLLMQVRPATLTGAEPERLTTPEVRYAAALHDTELQQHLVVADTADARKILDTLQQDWGMRYYSALGGTLGRGYFGADFTGRGVPWPVALAENVFSTFVLSEHGWLGGALVLAAYLVLIVFLLYAAAFGCAQRTFIPRALLLAGLAAFLAVPTLYMVAANASLLPLTGQNVPGLGLLSPADVALIALLGALAVTALPREDANRVGASLAVESRVRRIRNALGMTALAFTGLTLWLCAALWRPTHQPPGDFRIPRFTSTVEQLVAGRAIVAGDSLAIARSAVAQPAFRSTSFLRQMVAVSNAVDRGEYPGERCFQRDALLRATSADQVNVMSAFCGLAAGTSGRFAWRGQLNTSGRLKEMVLTDGRGAVVLSGSSTAQTHARLGPGCSPERPVRARAVQLGCERAVASITFGTSAYVLEPNDSVRVNAQALHQSHLLKPGDLIEASGVTALVADLPTGAVTYARWENGAFRRYREPGTAPWVQQLDVQLARALDDRGSYLRHAKLTIEPDLHTALSEQLPAACAALTGATACSVLLADPTNGRILAFGEWERRPREPGPHRPVDRNLRNHPSASTIKPIMAAAALSVYPGLSKLDVEHTLEEYTTIANTPIGQPIRARRQYPNSRVPFTGFLGASDNLYATTLGFLASARPGRDGLPALSGNSNESGLRVNGEPLHGRPVFPAESGLGLHRSPFAQALEQLYGVEAQATERTSTFDTRFWQRAIDANALPRSPELERIAPDAVVLDFDRVRDARELASFMIGGASNRWNNVALVQAFSRIYTMRAVELYLLESVGEKLLGSAPRETEQLRNVHADLRRGLATVVNQPWGTAYSLRSEFPRERVDWLAKTGTLAEQGWTGSLILFAGGPAQSVQGVCAASGVITIELESGANPDGRATALFRQTLAPMLREHRGWGERACVGLTN